MSSLDSFFVSLSEEQKKILELTEGKHLVLAPPGSGKTELLARRVVYAQKTGISPSNMLCLTFTKRAAMGMEGRVSSIAGKSELFIGNIHQYCAKFLFHHKIVSPVCSILDEEDSQQIVKEEVFDIEPYLSDLLKESNHPIGSFLKYNAYRTQKNKGFPADLLFPPDLLFPNELEKGCVLYEKIKEENRFLDYDDLLTYTYLNLKEHSGLNSYTWIQADEVQDLNPLQWELLNLLSSKDGHHVLFGDRGQAIFSFMGARIESLERIKKDYKVHLLVQNYRSPSYLVGIYNVFAKKHLGVDQPNIIPCRTEPNEGNLKFFTVSGDRYDETKYVVDILLPSINTKKEHTAILVRTNVSADRYSDILEKRKVEHFKVSGFDLFNRSIVKDSIAFLSTLADPKNRKAWSRVFKIYGKTKSLKESRELIKQIFNCGFLPSDFLIYPDKINYLLSAKTS